jgi:hypothetical protein
MANSVALTHWFFVKQHNFEFLFLNPALA